MEKSQLTAPCSQLPARTCSALQFTVPIAIARPQSKSPMAMLPPKTNSSGRRSNWSSGKYSGVCCIIPWQLTNVRTSVSRPLNPPAIAVPAPIQGKHQLNSTPLRSGPFHRTQPWRTEPPTHRRTQPRTELIPTRLHFPRLDTQNANIRIAVG